MINKPSKNQNVPTIHGLKNLAKKATKTGEKTVRKFKELRENAGVISPRKRKDAGDELTLGGIQELFTVRNNTKPVAEKPKDYYDFSTVLTDHTDNIVLGVSKGLTLDKVFTYSKPNILDDVEGDEWLQSQKMGDHALERLYARRDGLMTMINIGAAQKFTISEEQAEYLFSLDSLVEGSGEVARELKELLGGSLSADSDHAGDSARFALRLIEKAIAKVHGFMGDIGRENRLTVANAIGDARDFAVDQLLGCASPDSASWKKPEGGIGAEIRRQQVQVSKGVKQLLSPLTTQKKSGDDIFDDCEGLTRNGFNEQMKGLRWNS